MNARRKSFSLSLSHLLLPRLSLVALPLLGVAGLSTPPVSAEPIVIQPTAPAATSVLRTPTTSNDEVDRGLDPKDFSQGLLFPYSLLDTALAGNVDLEGNVLYPNLKDNKRLLAYVQAAAHADLSQFPVFDVFTIDPETGRKSKVTKNHAAELVFWINTYNAMVLSTIAQAYPIKSINDIKDFDTASTHVVAGKSYSFKEMRAKVLSFGDPRALFSLVSGTAGGFLPAPKAVRYVELDRRLDAAVSSFVNDPRNVTLNRIQNLVTVNPLFKDVEEPFKTGGRKGKWDGIRAILSGYTEQRGSRSYFTTNDYRIEFGKGNRIINDRTSVSQTEVTS